ncbi:McrB family protein [Helicobacter suis]|uniref:McrB family protein n=1 Tax=Helicobacter suis TaxID=104628 RepID=UPI001F0725E8|nr:AAA family ATPase [Helicobacter suis]
MNTSYKIEDGIFKRICEASQEDASQKKDFLKTDEKITQEIGVEDLLEEYAQYIENQLKIKKQLSEKKTLELLELEKTLELKSEGSRTEMKIRKVDLKNGFSIHIGQDGSNSGQNLTKDVFVRDYPDFKDGKIKSYKDIKPTRPSQKERHGNSRYYYALFKKLKEFEENHQYNPTPPSPKVEESKYNSNTQLNSKSPHKKPYILIIDEINRGNIAKIFGELITLIEPSKRIGNEESLKVTLPYSQESFGVPNNLYIIGTMNTADSSIALLDIALRRRFSFVEMMPKSTLLSTNCSGVDLQELLEAINKRIGFLLDQDHSIGHAYFLDLETLQDLQDCFKNKIIPLLQEYFYDDHAKIDVVLNGNGMLEAKEFKDISQGLLKDFVDPDKKIYTLTEASGWEVGHFKKIYGE